MSKCVLRLYRIVYSFGSVRAECCIRAKNEKFAVKKFKELKGDKVIFDIYDLGV